MARNLSILGAVRISLDYPLLGLYRIDFPSGDECRRMSETKPAADAEPARALQPISDYRIPPMPTDVATRRMVRWFRLQFKKSEDAEPFVAESELVQASRETLEDVAPSPACGPLLRDLDAHFATLIGGDDQGSRLRLMLLPPGDRSEVLSGWAKRHALEVLPCPPRERLLDEPRPPGLDVQQLWPEEASHPNSVLVIPKLESWFLRHERGLFLVRQLLDRLEQSRRPLIIGCSTWAWDFLCKATQAGLVLPSPLTFQAFGADELYDWFRFLEEDAEVDVRVRLSSSGADLFADDAKKHHYFKGLAAESLGIPWVAWHRWRKSLRYKRPSDAKAESADQPGASGSDGHTLWVTTPPPMNLPQGHFEQMSLVLQALLIHGRLTLDELRAVVPIVGELRVVSALLQTGFIRYCDRHLYIVPTAYPETRRELIAAGFPHPAI